MDPISIGTTAISMLQLVLGASKSLFGTPDWIKYVNAGLHIASQALSLIKDAQDNPGKYDNLTADEIRAMLQPAEWDDLEARARAELGL